LLAYGTYPTFRLSLQIDDNNPVQFVIKPTTAFVKVFDMFCAKQNLDVGAYRLRLTRRRVLID